MIDGWYFMFSENMILEACLIVGLASDRLVKLVDTSITHCHVTYKVPG